MIKKFFKELKESIIEDYVFIIVCLLTVIIFNIPVNYYIITGGGIEDVGEKIAIKDSYNSRGSYNMCYVSEIRGRVGPYLLSYVIPSWDREKVSDYTYNDKETIKDVEFRDKLDLKVANSNALYWAYTLAGLETKMIKREIYIISYDSDHNDKFKVGDILVSIDGKIFNSFEEIHNYLYNLDKDDVEVVVKRGKEEVIINSKIYYENGKKYIGIALEEYSEYYVNPKVKFSFSSNESGPSAGLITTLAIYDKLTKEDLTKGKKIAATGTIEKDGTIGQVGGIKYKLQGAVKKKADIFFVPSGDNYKEAAKLQQENNYDIKIIEAKDINSVIEELKK